MSADRDYWMELKQLLRWYMIPGLVPSSCLACPGSSGLVQSHPVSSSLVPARLDLSGLVLARPARPGLSGLVQARPARSGSSKLIWAHQGLSYLV